MAPSTPCKVVVSKGHLTVKTMPKLTQKLDVVKLLIDLVTLSSPSQRLTLSINELKMNPEMSPQSNSFSFSPMMQDTINIISENKFVQNNHITFSRFHQSFVSLLSHEYILVCLCICISPILSFLAMFNQTCIICIHSSCTLQ